jgi:hypothetical protein
MPVPKISQSILMNRGLNSAALDMDTSQEIRDARVSLVDSVGEFKKLVETDLIAESEQGLVAAITAANTPADLASFFINSKFNDLGGVAGLLGTTVSAILATRNGEGFVRSFRDGLIVWHPTAGTHAIYGPIRTRWQQLGGENGFLGFPTSDVTAGADTRGEGQFAHFQGGSIYWAPLPHRSSALESAISIEPVAELTFAPAIKDDEVVSSTGSKLFLASSARATEPKSTATEAASLFAKTNVSADLVASSAGAFEVHGAILQRYLALGAEASILGYPRTDETATPDGIGRYNHFQGGSIYWTPDTSAHEVHGLIRDRWASLGWERNPQLGYPISNELIPDLRVGHRRPEARKKPIVSIPNDVIKLPAEAVAAGFPASVVNIPLAAEKPMPVASSISKRDLSVAKPQVNASALGKLSEKPGQLIRNTATPLEIAPAQNRASDAALAPLFTNASMPASTPADHRSVNRFSDFENGVLFWFRGNTNAATLSPLASTSDGTSLTFTGAEIAAAAMAKIGRATFETSGSQVLAMTFVGTTAYSYDGAQVHNRRHRLQMIVQGTEPAVLGIPLPVTATIELQIEVWFDASQRRIVFAPVEWNLLQASSGSFGNTMRSALHAKLDALLWASFELLTLPDTDADAPIAVLSVKTLPNGAVGVFVEPHHNLIMSGIELFTSAVTPSSILFAQPNS